MSNKKIIFQVLSDLHLERFADFLHKSPLAYTRPVPPTAKKLIENKLLCQNRWIYTHPKTADYLVLVGDIGNPHIKNYHDYFDYCSPRYKQVFVVSGNHEYYFPHSFTHSKNIAKNWMDDTEYLIKSMVLKYPNIHFLQNNHIQIQHLDFQNILLYGATLWSPIPQSLKYMGHDFHKIPHWSWSMRNKIHMKHYHGIIDFIKYRAYSLCPEYRKKSPFHKLIMTHYLPSRTLLLPKYKNSEQSKLFASSIWEELIHDQSTEDIKSIKAWFYGHTHQSSRDLQKQQPINPIFFSNPIGNIESKSFEDIVESFETNVYLSLED